MQKFKIVDKLESPTSLHETIAFIKTLNLTQLATLILDIVLNKRIHDNSSSINSQAEINFYQRILAEIEYFKKKYTFPAEIDDYGLAIYREQYAGTEENFVKTKLLSSGVYQLMIDADKQHSFYISPACLTLIEYDNGRIIKRQGTYEKLKFYIEHMLFDMNLTTNVKIHRIQLNQSDLAVVS
ncbi:MAG: hypothetical protein ACJAVV_001465 [Alphaproteobacteria bacterium]|jgi:hypothetical protein